MMKHQSENSITRIAADFVQLLFASCQLYVFRLERAPDAHVYPGGDNREIVSVKKVRKPPSPVDEEQARTPGGRVQEVHVTEKCPVPDFISYTKTYLDMCKVEV